jgi:hypothetical protein
MHIRDLVILFVTAAAACASNPDPRARSIRAVAHDGHGGWIKVTTKQGPAISGELISVDASGLHILTGPQQSVLVFLPKTKIESAKLWAWETQPGGLALWGLAGTVSTISHGFFLIFSAPIWIVTTTITASVESRASQLEYPDDGWDKFSIWARFPQGMPPGVTGSDLVRQNRSPPGPPAQPGPPAPPAPPAQPAPSPPPPVSAPPALPPPTA